MPEITLEFLRKERENCWIELQRLNEVFLEKLNCKNGEKNSHGCHLETYTLTDKTLIEMQKKKLEAFDEAIKRWYSETYGICLGDKCGNGKIPIKRLKSKPYAAFCVACLESTPKS